jgi:signal transduction histidine kinase
MRRITRAMVRFRKNPEDASRIVASSSRRDEIGIAERELGAMQQNIYDSLHQRARLAALGTNTLRYGRTEEHSPQRRMVRLKPIVEEALEAALSGKDRVMPDDRVDSVIEVDADAAQLFRILLNIARNAGDALAEEGGTISVQAAREEATTRIDIADNGAGIPEKIRERLFQPFAGTTRAGGTGLGLAIARDLARAHGGDVILLKSDATGTQFRVTIPDREE